MHTHYHDILDRITEPPSWWDQNGTPRYGAFTPQACPDIYSNQVVLLEIACQACGTLFQVEMHMGLWDDVQHSRLPREWHYGDPPYHGCVGDTMNCDDRQVMEVWSRQTGQQFVRQPQLEGPIARHW